MQCLKDPTIRTNLQWVQTVPLDREAAYSIAIALTELHSRRCNQVMMCGDMQESTEAAFAIIEISRAYNEINLICADIDNIQPEPINV